MLKDLKKDEMCISFEKLIKSAESFEKEIPLHIEFTKQKILMLSTDN